ncbi:hypothetical protein FQR65_LT02048 [Abscondita terminalis]|nr:hypothetical protein FQR65_LT02048 [Abscondita terminalis]
MKTVIAIAFLIAFVTLANANLENGLSLQFHRDVIMNCLLNNLSVNSNEDLSSIWQTLKEWLIRFSECLSVNGAAEDDILILMQCVMEKVGEASEQELIEIAKLHQLFRC